MGSKAERNLYQILSQGPDWNATAYNLSELSGGSSTLDRPSSIGSERLKKILESVPGTFPYGWELPKDKGGEIDWDQMTPAQREILGEILRPPIPSVYTVKSIITRASLLKQALNLK